MQKGDSFLLAAEVSKQDLVKACESLFGEDVTVSVEFLHYLKPDGVKAAFRKRALETHPDRAVLLTGEIGALEKRFKEINLAHQLLQQFLSCPWKYSLDERGSIFKPRSRPVHPAGPRPKSASPEKRFPGKLPARKLLFGHYLYYSGRISLSTLIKAVVWQRLQRPSIGAIATRWEWLDAHDIYYIMRQRRHGEKFGECSFRLGCLSKYQLLLLLDKQRLMQPKLGKYFVEKKITTAVNINKLINEMNLYNKNFRSY